ncbi:MAG: type IV pilus modification PilV family protein, partial [Planctomycetota bacterium]
MTLARGRRAAAAGVTLVEVVIAIFVLTVGVLGIISLFPTGYRLGQMSFDRSVAALAARDALPRVLAELKPGGSLDYPDDDTQSLASVADEDRVGIIAEIPGQTQVRCKTHGGTRTPSYDSMDGYYLVITSGSASGKAYRITGGSGNTLTCSNAQFRRWNDDTGDRIRVGDHYAIIGSTNSPCFPTSFLTGSGTSRTREVATHGSRGKKRDGAPAPWEYTYGCILSAPSDSM